MYAEENALRGLFTKIAIVLLFLVLFFNIYSLAYVARDGLVSLFEGVIWLDCLTDIACAFLYFLSFVLPVLIFYGLMPKAERRGIDFSIRLPSPTPLFKTLAILFVSIGTIISFSYFNIWVVPATSSGVSLAQSKEPYQMVLLMFSGAIIPAFAEELLFRGVIVTHLKPYGKGVAVLASALLFGAMHMNFSQLLYATAAGVVLGVVYVITNSLWLCILIHFANNLFNIVEGYLFEIFRAERANMICMLAELVIFALGILFALLYVLFKKETKVSQKTLGVFGTTESTDMYLGVGGGHMLKAFFCPAMIVYLVVVLLNMLYTLFAQKWIL